MYARVTTTRIQPGKVEEAIGIARDSIAPAAREQRGFGGFLLLADREAGKGLAITLWETEDDLRASEASGYYREQLGKLKEVLAGPPEREAYEVSVRV
ncbi:antibiotic biosynthesis monooxygenase family protein [Rubrobacter xylanophilus]|uniref:antibiotic biosynthesis monooxygenase family protein n=1 Tax=Rubrobacter xylanophilus TaxID=49319 RepID=UPI00003A2135|nr:antibiotic biosynthesis monooxygenase [Rubrobacter xylanophilus]